MRFALPLRGPLFAALSLLALGGCGSTAATDPPPLAATAIARAAPQARGVRVAAQVASPTPGTTFPLIAPDPPFAALPNADGPIPAPSGERSSEPASGTPL